MMIKNLCLLGLLTWVSHSLAMHPIAREGMGAAESFKVEKPREEQDAQRSVAGEKIKRKRKLGQPKREESQTTDSDSDSEVRYWQYSE
jgi:hypothetical protein